MDPVPGGILSIELFISTLCGKEALKDILHYTSGASMITEFDEDLFTRFVDRIIVYSRTEIGFDMKCGPIFPERI
jgi:hypothetical protein